MYLRTNDSAHGKSGSPYYVGKGAGRRAFQMTHRCKPPKDRSRIVFLAQKMNEKDAFQAEMLLIFLYGRMDKGTGCLANLTDGGEGSHGLISAKKGKKANFSLDALRRISEASKGRKMSDAQKAQISAIHKGRRRSQETCKNISESLRGNSLSEESRRKISEALTGRKQSPDLIANRIAARAGYRHSQETIEKMRNTPYARRVQ